MAHLPTIHDLPIFIFIVLALYTIYKLNKVKTYIAEGDLRQSFYWLVIASISFTLWGVIHLISDFLVFDNKNIEIFLHYWVSHIFLLFSMICIAISANKIERSYKKLEGELGFGKKKK